MEKKIHNGLIYIKEYADSPGFLLPQERRRDRNEFSSTKREMNQKNNVHRLAWHEIHESAERAIIRENQMEAFPKP